MDINRANGAGPSRQAVNEGGSDSDSSLTLPIIAVQQAVAEEVVTTQAQQPVRTSVIVRPVSASIASIIAPSGLAPEPPVVNPNVAFEQSTSAASTRRAQASAGVRHHPYSSGIFRSDTLEGPSRWPYPYFLFIPNRPPQSVLRPALESDEQAGPSRLQPRNVPPEPHRPTQSVLRAAVEPDAQAGPSGVHQPSVPFAQPRFPPIAPRPTFEPEARGRLPDYALAGPSTEPKPYAPTCVVYGRLTGDAYPEAMRQRAIALYKGYNNSRQIADQLRLEFPARSPSVRTVSKWIEKHLDSERERQNETSDSD